MLPRMSTAFVATETIARPVETVWRILTDWDRAPDWMPGVEQARARRRRYCPECPIRDGERRQCLIQGIAGRRHYSRACPRRQ
jgi:uncharacterized protein YndB with AHSA1/START domain